MVTMCRLISSKHTRFAINVNLKNILRQTEIFYVFKTSLIEVLLRRKKIF